VQFFDIGKEGKREAQSGKSEGSAACGKWGRNKHAILRNEPIFISRIRECILRVQKKLELWKASFKMGSFWKNEPI
jgi:hypothetical protein